MTKDMIAKTVALKALFQIQQIIKYWLRCLGLSPTA